MLVFMAKNANEMVTGSAQIDGSSVKTIKREFVSANILRITVGTNCPQGGDAGHGGRTIVVLEDTGSTDMRCAQLPGGVELVFGGDAECETLISALEFAAETLRNMQTENRHGS
jgi:hypothetical protein